MAELSKLGINTVMARYKTSKLRHQKLQKASDNVIIVPLGKQHFKNLVRMKRVKDIFIKQLVIQLLQTQSSHLVKSIILVWLL